MKEACLITGVCLWGLTVGVEYYHGHEFVKGQLSAPCTVVGQYSGFNLMCLGFPVALVLIAEVMLMNEVGAIGLTPMLETMCLLGILGSGQIRTMHVPLCIIAGIAFCCMCLNLTPYGMAATIPMAFLTFVYIVYVLGFRPKENIQETSTVTSVIYLCLDFWSIFGRLLLLCARYDASEFHYIFDTAAFGALLAILLLMWGLLFVCPCNTTKCLVHV